MINFDYFFFHSLSTNTLNDKCIQSILHFLSLFFSSNTVPRLSVILKLRTRLGFTIIQKLSPSPLQRSSTEMNRMIWESLFLFLSFFFNPAIVRMRACVLCVSFFLPRHFSYCKFNIDPVFFTNGERVSASFLITLQIFSFFLLFLFFFFYFSFRFFSFLL